MGRLSAALLGIAIVMAAVSAGANASGPLPAGVLHARPTAAEIPTTHLARLTAAVPAYREPGDRVTTTLPPGGVIRTGQAVRGASGRWLEVITPHGLLWVPAAALAEETVPPLR